MNRLLLFLFVIFSFQVFFPLRKESFGQIPNMWDAWQGKTIMGKISGTVQDSVTAQPMPFATVALTKTGESKITNGCIADEKGSFKLENVPTGIYTLTVTFLGYNKEVVDSLETTLEKPDRYLGIISLGSSVILMNKVTVEGDAPIIENKVDRIIYNAEKDITSQGGDATDVLRKVPMLSVDLDGNVSLRGSENVKILINDKPSGMMATTIADALKMIPADQIKSIEVITSPGAKYDAEGTAGIINIITKKKNIEGMNGTVNASGGTRNNSLNSNLNYKKGRTGLNASLGGNFNLLRKGTTEFYREDTYDSTTRTLSQNGIFTPQRMGFSGSGGWNYDFNAYHNISANVRYNNYSFARKSDMDVHFVEPAFTSDYLRNSSTLNLNQSIDASADYRRTFKDSPKEFSAELQLTDNFNDNNYSLEQTGIFSSNEKSFNNGENRELTGKADYTLPFKKITLETGIKGIMRVITSDYTFEFLNDSTGGYENNPNRSDKFEYNQSIGAAYLTIDFKIKNKYEFKPGIRYEYTDNNGDFSSGSVPMKNSYDNFIPSINILRTLKNFKSIKLNYSHRIQRPGLRNMNPFIDRSDPKNISTGNPNLIPELSHSFELGYSAFSKKTSGSASLYYRYTTDVIQSYTEVDTNGVSVTSYQNIGYSNNGGINLFGQILLFKKWTLRGSANIYYVSQNGEYNSVHLFNDDIQYNLFINSSWELPKGWSAEYFGMLNSPRSSIQGTLPSMSMMSVGVKKELWKEKGSIAAQVYNPFNPDLKFKTDLSGDNFYQQSVNIVPFFSFGVSFSYKFGKIDFKDEIRNRRKNMNDDMNKMNEEGY